MLLSPTQIYKDIFKEEPPKSWTEGTPDERQRAISDFMADAAKVEVSDAEFEVFLDAIQQNRNARKQNGIEILDAA